MPEKGKLEREGGTEGDLTVESAAARLEHLLSGDPGDKGAAEPKPTEKPKATPAEPTPAAAVPEHPAAGEGESDDEDEQDGDEHPTLRKFRVKVNDVDEEVDEVELVKGYSRTADYTRKTQALAEQRKAFEAEQERVREERALYAQRLDEMAKTLQRAEPAEVDWDKLRNELTPDDFATRWSSWSLAQKNLARIAEAKADVDRKVAADYKAKMDLTLKAERAKLHEKVPAWKDPDVEKKEMSELFAFAMGQGYSKEELENIYDSRSVLLLRRAFLQDQAEQAKPVLEEIVDDAKERGRTIRPAPPPPRVATPGGGKPKPPATKQQKAISRLARTGAHEHAAAAFEAFID